MIDTAVLLQIVTLVGGGAYTLFSAWKARRDRRDAKEDRAQERAWSIEDEDRKEEKRKDERDEILDRVLRTARTQAEKDGRITRREVRRVATTLSETKQVNEQALTEANRINLKLIRITHALREAIATTDPSTAERLAEIEGVARELDNARRERQDERTARELEISAELEDDAAVEELPS